MSLDSSAPDEEGEEDDLDNVRSSNADAVLKSFKEETDNVRRHAAEHLKHATARRGRGGNINSSSLEPLCQGVLHLPV
ncbi:hypothetical protein ABVT39_004101 [Epinephelus coioides]